MGKMHELLAVEPDVTATSKKIVEEAANTFRKKEDRFIGLRKTYEPRVDGDVQFPADITQVVETVPSKLAYVAKAVTKAINIVASKEVTNVQTSAKLKIGDLEIGDFPAPVFLALERQLKEFRSMLVAIPTLDPAYKWTIDSDRNDIRVSNPTESLKTEKKQEVIVKYEATKEHPAQTEIFNKDIVVGTWTTIRESGMITPKEKSEILGRVDQAIQAVKKARQRANDVAVTNITIGEKLLDFIIGKPSK